MASISLKNVVIDFPVYGVQPLFRKELFARLSSFGGRNPDDRRRRVVVRAIDNLSIELNHGDQIGLVGPNGAGKSTLLRVLAGIYYPSQGSVEIQGGVSPLFNTSPGLDLDDTGYENIYTCGLFLGMTPAEIAQKTPEIAEFSELGDYLKLPVRTYSAGMLVRLGFSVATAIDPEILLLDEGLGAGDARFAARAHERVAKLVGRSSILVLASHSDGLIKQMCNRALLVDQGKVLMDGKPDEVLAYYHEQLKETKKSRITLAQSSD